ncbi:hypothetical protein [Amycolatopsis sp. RTGN1]|uniref:hypothetical protein n=1 Tax=Amycolatopsis ponsaeliensis TaxID=2992142 RepID=UPI00254E36C0|nr:hypothetical protein [Amycolatopsis sp. RTGN1]
MTTSMPSSQPSSEQDPPLLHPEHPLGAAILTFYRDLCCAEGTPLGEENSVLVEFLTRVGIDTTQDPDTVERQLRQARHHYTVVGLRDYSSDEFFVAAVLPGNVPALDSEDGGSDFQRHAFLVIAADPQDAELFAELDRADDDDEFDVA